MDRLLPEVIVQTVSDARQATRGGADRLEVVRAIRDGGLTPPLSLVRAIAEETALPLRVMVRENAGYAMGADELKMLRAAAVDFSGFGVDGIVIGFAERGQLALDDVCRVIEAAPESPGHVPPCVRSAARSREGHRRTDADRRRSIAS